MAKVSFGGGVVDMRGSIGNTTFSRAKNGATARVRVKGTNPQTADQASVRSIMTDASRAWAGVLTSGQRDSWNGAAGAIAYVNPTNGSTFFLSGAQYYSQLRANFVRMNATGTAVPTAPPASSFTPAIVSVTLTGIVGATGVVSGTFGAAVATTQPMELLYQPLNSVGRQPVANKWKSLGFASNPTTPFSFTKTVKTRDRGKPAYAFAYRWAKQTTGQVSQITVLAVFIPT